MKQFSKRVVSMVLLLTLVLSSALPAVAATVEGAEKELPLSYFDIAYENGGIRILGFNKETVANRVIKDLVFPSQDAEGKQVIAIGNGSTAPFAEDFGKVVLPNSLKSIEGKAFEGISTDSIVIPENVVSIGHDAFANADIREIKLPNNVATFGNNVFKNTNAKLYNVAGALNGTGILGEAVFENTVIDGDLVIAGTLRDIPARTFKNAEITGDKILLGAGIEVIGDEAFSGLKSKNTINGLELPNTTKKIGNEAFYKINSLSGKLIVPKSVEEIGRDSFKYLLNLDTFVYYPESAKIVGRTTENIIDEVKDIFNPQNIFDHMGLYKYDLDIAKLATIKPGSIISNTVGELIEFAKSILTKDRAMNKDLVIVTHQRLNKEVFDDEMKLEDGLAALTRYLINYKRGPENVKPFFGKAEMKYDSDYRPIKEDYPLGEISGSSPVQLVMAGVNSKVDIKIPVNEIRDDQIKGKVKFVLEDELYRYNVKDAYIMYNKKPLRVPFRELETTGNYLIDLSDKFIKDNGFVEVRLEGRLEFRKGVLDKFRIPSLANGWKDIVDIPGDTIKTLRDLFKPLQLKTVILTNDAGDRLQTESELRLHTIPNFLYIEDIPNVEVFEGEEAKLPARAQVMLAANITQNLGEEPTKFYTGNFRIKWDPVNTDLYADENYREVRLKAKWDIDGSSPIELLEDYTNILQGPIKDLEDLKALAPRAKVIIKRAMMLDTDKVLDLGTKTIAANEAVNLPKTATVKYENGEKKDLDIVWNNEMNDYDKEQMLYGYVYDGVSMRDVQLKVVRDEAVVENKIEAIKGLAPIKVKKGEEVALPETVTAVMTDGSEKEVAVVWNEFTADQAGEFKVEGTVEGTAIKAVQVVVVAGDVVVGEETIHEGYLNGYEDGTIRPIAQLSRAEAASILFRLIEDKNVVYYHNFKDVKGHWAEKEIATLSNMGILKGVGGGNFNPNGKMSRAEVVTMLVNYLGLNTNVSVTSPEYKDHWGAKYIEVALAEGIIKGYEDGSVRPDGQVTRAEFAAMINNIFDRCGEDGVDASLEGVQGFSDLNPNAWYYEIMLEATNSHKCVVKDGVNTWVSIY